MSVMHKTPLSIDSVIPVLEKEVAAYKVPIVDLVAAQTKDPRNTYLL